MTDKVSALEDPLLGRLSWNAELGWFDGQILHGTETYRVHLSVSDEDDPHASLGEAISAVKSARSRLEEFKVESANRLLELYNDEWRNEGDAVKDASEFVACLSMESITGYPDRSAEVTFTDGELFAGHLIIVSVEDDGSISDVTIAG
jgi:hypothetical protein